MRSTLLLAPAVCIACVTTAACGPQSASFEFAGDAGSVSTDQTCAAGSVTPDVLTTDPNASPTILVTGGNVYWVDHGNNISDTIMSVSAQGGSPNTVFTAFPDPTAAIEDVVTDGKNLYFIQVSGQGSGEFASTVSSIPLSGGTATELGATSTAALVIGVAGGYVYVADNAGNEASFSAKGGPVDPPPLTDAPTGFVAVGGSLFYVTESDGLDVLPSGADKSSVVSAATADNQYLSGIGGVPMAVNDDYVFWPCVDETGFLVCQTAQHGGPDVVLTTLSGRDGVGLVADDSNIYFLDTGSDCPAVTAIPVNGGTPTVIAADENPVTAISMPHGLATDGNYLYWVASPGQIVSAPVP
jgi:hypothetical protein